MKKIYPILTAGLLLLCACGENKNSASKEAPPQWVDTYESLGEAMAVPGKVQLLKLNKFDKVQLPPELGKLTNLRELTILEAPNLKSTKGIGELKQLESLFIGDSALEEIAPDVAELKRLKVFQLGASKLTKFPEQIWSLSKLESLIIGGPHYLNSLPKEVGSLKALSELRIGVRIKPSSSGVVQDDGLITIPRDQIVETPFSIPAEIGGLTQLRRLALTPTNIGPLPREIGNLQNLELLLLESDGLKSIPAEIGNLKKLKVLVLSQNELTQLPEEISQLNNLKTLRLTGNPLPDAEKARIKTLIKQAEVEY